ncbi:hypothetical protein PybrP1_004301 [[Pythium] brassicae (nom. inval.)]|nr:hypothetical protein PybrP1_004301 [[Pythium] brassicae (nom. inval.)]
MTLRHRSAAPTNDSAASRNFLAPKKTLYDRVTYFVSLLVGTILNPIESEKERVATGIMFSFLSGCILLALRFLNLSQVADFFSRPVMGGFISAGGFLIALAQVQNSSRSRSSTPHQ